MVVGEIVVAGARCCYCCRPCLPPVLGGDVVTLDALDTLSLGVFLGETAEDFLDDALILGFGCWVGRWWYDGRW